MSNPANIQEQTRDACVIVWLDTPSTPPQALYGLRVTANLFPTLGVTPALGRNIVEAGRSTQLGTRRWALLLSAQRWRAGFLPSG